MNDWRLEFVRLFPPTQDEKHNEELIRIAYFIFMLLRERDEIWRVKAEAGEKLREEVGKMNLPDDNGRKDILPEKIAQLYDKTPLGTFNYGLNEANRYWRNERDAAISTYDKEVKGVE